MSAGELLLGLLRLGGLVLPLLVLAHRLRTALLDVGGAIALLAETVIATSVLLVFAEALGVVGLDRAGALIAALAIAAALSLRLRPSTAVALPPEPGTAGTAPTPRAIVAGSMVAVVIVAGQWVTQVANALGSGMLNFDTLWYHMPFAARLAQTGSVTGIQFTQADPFVAYYPANSELLHALGIAALHGDLASPLLNLLWLAVALLASWCIGRPWRVPWHTLIAGCLVLSLPMLASTQPGEAFNDAFGLSMLLAAVAIVVNGREQPRALALAGLGLGLAAGTKFTFVVPALALIAGLTVSARRGRRGRVLLALAAPAAVTCGWWYLRNLIDVGNPLGLGLHVGPISLPGPTSPLAGALTQTVISQLTHVTLWGSRFAPGLAHALGPLWPLLLALYLASTAAAVALPRAPVVRVLGLTAAVAGISYLLLPTGAANIAHETNLFEVNLRYAAPAGALGLTLAPIVLRLRAPRALTGLGAAMVVVEAVTQLERSLWPAQPGRHLAFSAAAAALLAAVLLARRLRLRSYALAAAGAGLLLVAVAAAGYAVQRHYFDRRYLLGDRRNADPGIGAIYRWAQRVSHARIALYGTVEQYPLYGARDSNTVEYLGEASGDGGFRPISSCRRWRNALRAGDYRYVVLTPGPTAAVPLTWTAADPALRMVLHPSAEDFVFQAVGRPHVASCG
jgi:hypothetical protein